MVVLRLTARRAASLGGRGSAASSTTSLSTNHTPPARASSGSRSNTCSRMDAFSYMNRVRIVAHSSPPGSASIASMFAAPR